MQEQMIVIFLFVSITRNTNDMHVYPCKRIHRLIVLGTDFNNSRV